MGKKGRKTRWRTLTITDEHSDSEESNTTTSGHHVPKGYPHKSYYSRFTYSSQSTPTRRYQCDGTKSTRSSSTASENKITFNEDEYTRITTPRQDVLFKKGYLNKPKTYQTQTSTGNSTTSTGNSTGNGTPDHQSTDLEYESQFVFPNGFVDQNGIYYVNSFEPYPLMVYNPPTYYPEFSSVKSKRCSTGSLTESTSPNNEETSQDLSQGETPNNVSDFNQVYNVVYPGFYYNGACQPQDVADQPEPRRMKKKRKRKVSRSESVREATTSEYTDESSDEVFSDEAEKTTTDAPPPPSSDPVEVDAHKPDDSTEPRTDPKHDEEPAKVADDEAADKTTEDDGGPKSKYDLKPDAEEFVPRAYRQPETIPMEPPSVQFIKIPSNFVPIPILNPIGDFNAFIPHGIPINFIPQNYVNFIPSFANKTESGGGNAEPEKAEQQQVDEVRDTVEVPKNRIDIAKIVSKLEEAAKEQDNETTMKEPTESPKKPTRNLKRNRCLKVETKPQISDESSVVAKPKEETPSPKPITRNYSDTLKKPLVVQIQKCERHQRHMEKQIMNQTTPKEVIAKNHVKIEQAKTPNQWISVSNRKKRKNRNVEETEDFDEPEEKDKELLESHDIKLLEEAIPSHPNHDIKLVEEVIPPKEPEVIIEPVKIEPEPTIATEEPEKEKKEKPKPTPKKKPKKTQKPATKRVIIKDIDLSMKEEIVEEPKSKEVVIEEKPIEIAEPPIEDKKEPTPEKKAKKKKKKVAKAAIASSDSGSNATLLDDSYDFLLETSLLDESQEKTNVEVSQELDKMIQRGMYSSLEEKIKSLNIESNDNFFKSIIHNISSRESSVEKNSYDFGKILSGTAQLLKSKPTMMEAAKLGDFLGEVTPKLGGEKNELDKDNYPITRAVKEWMTKARETTPDVEILKSPSAILREFGETEDGKNGSVDGDTEIDDEVTVYSLSREGSVAEPTETSTSSAEEAEEVPEVYDSKYGKNEDYLRIKAEVEERKGSFPKHGNLPYRAICCSIM